MKDATLSVGVVFATSTLRGCGSVAAGAGAGFGLLAGLAVAVAGRVLPSLPVRLSNCDAAV